MKVIVVAFLSVLWLPRVIDSGVFVLWPEAKELRTYTMMGFVGVYHS